MLDNMGVIEKKVLGALLILMGDDNIATSTQTNIANEIGYKTSGGAISFALRLLEQENYILKTGKSTYKVLV